MAKLKNASRAGAAAHQVHQADHSQSRASAARNVSYDHHHQHADPYASQHAMGMGMGMGHPSFPASSAAQQQPAAAAAATASQAQPHPTSFTAQVTGAAPATDSLTFYHPERFPNYNPALLNWNDLHTLNTEGLYCYCGQDRYLDLFMLQCKVCKNWFHDGCVSAKIGHPVPFFTNYDFTCGGCHPSGVEAYARTQPAWKEVVATVLANLMMQKIRETHQDMSATALTRESIEPSLFIREDFARFIEANWHALWGNKEMIAKVWRGTLSTTLYQYRDIFITTVDTRITQAPFTLFDQNLFNIRPGYLDMFSKTPGHSRVSARILPALKNATEQVAGSSTQAAATGLQSLQQLESTIPGTTSATVFIGDTACSLLRNRGQRKERQGVALPPASIPPGAEHPFNRDGFKYRLAEINPALRYAVYRECNAAQFRGAGNVPGSMSREDRSPAVVLSKDGTGVATDGGFRSARAMYPMRQGTWYFEVFVDRAGEADAQNEYEKPHVRIGVAKREASLLGPVGYDDVGFAYRDKTGDKVTNSRPARYGEAYASGDVIGVLVVLPPWAAVDKGAKATTWSPNTRPGAGMRDRTAIRFKTQVYLETKDYLPLRDHPLPPQPAHTFPAMPNVPGSKLVFFKNGVCQGIAFEDLPAPVRHVCARMGEQIAKEDDGSLGYYPAVSCYRGGKVTVNMGPHFMYPLPEEGWDPLVDGVDALIGVQLDRASVIGTRAERAAMQAAAADAEANADQHQQRANAEENADAMDVDGREPIVAPAPAPEPAPAMPASSGGMSTRATRSNTSVPDPAAIQRQQQLEKQQAKLQKKQQQQQQSQSAVQSPPPGATAVTAPRAASAYPAQWDHDVEECVWDLLDEIDHWHALDDEPGLRGMSGLVFPARTETYAEHVVAMQEKMAAGGGGIGGEGNAGGQPLTLRELLMPTMAPPQKRARVKWA
ncbi:hypothetical protein BCR44DRAFT_1437341 [Catenaria anguillulae PL171]|uniref:B30.2/SPRY domain-containing protein n=1 Tax=Catenaria anguillulae PL171 TaxID=765915 RepID=A0A1Y2HH68_9FUNG|nr:hypothetical protein BCR44DRAFT_1437341 [Catenaria anguillulae PL171]